MEKYQFYKNNIRFLGYIVLVQKIKIEDKKIKKLRNQLKLKLV